MASATALSFLLMLLISYYEVQWAAASPYPSLGGYELYAGDLTNIEAIPHLKHTRHRRSPKPEDRETCQGQATPPANRVDSRSQLSQLRQKMEGQVQAYIIPMADAHQSEYVSDHDKRIQFISGFSGSAGTVVVLDSAKNKAALWVDGRYFLQGEQQLDCQWTLMKSGVSGVPSVTGWLAEVLQPGDKVGVDPRMLRYDSWISYKAALSKANLTLVEMTDLAGAVWDETGTRPPAANDPLLILEMDFAGESWQDKVKRVRDGFGSNADAAAITALDETAWLFNLRGTDIAYNPVFFSYTIVEKDKVTMYLLGLNDRLTQAIKTHLNTNSEGECNDPSNCVEVKDYAQFYPDMAALPSKPGVQKVWVSPMASYALFSSLGQTEDEAKERAFLSPSLVRTLKGRKNKVEIEGLRRCHIRDSAALVEFVAGLEKDVKEGLKEWDEISASDALDNLRKQQTYNKGLSFHTISGSGSNGAVIHYTASEATKKPITTTDMYLLDSGGQYLDGTTDVTRTFHFGEPTAFQKEAYTRVLMGVIDLASVIWPNGTYGRDLDVLARRPLWAVGLDYRHGTGHGIGFFLNVHEGVDPIEMDLREWVGQLEEALEDNSDRLDGILKLLKKRTKYECSSSDEEPETTKIEVRGRSKTKQNREGSPSPDYSSDESTCSKSPSRKKKDPAKKYLRKKFLEGTDKVKTGPGRINIGYRRTSYESPLYGEMFFSDEPGYYQDGEFGVRLETIVMTKPVTLPHRFGDKDYLGFETFTLVPFETNLINLDLLTALQRRWLNAYHKKVQEEVAEKVLKPAGKTLAYDWVTARTKPIPDTPSYTSHAHKGSSTPTILCLAMLLVTAMMRV